MSEPTKMDAIFPAGIKPHSKAQLLLAQWLSDPDNSVNITEGKPYAISVRLLSGDKVKSEYQHGEFEVALERAIARARVLEEKC
jgi:hypothetical protein